MTCDLGFGIWDFGTLEHYPLSEPHRDFLGERVAEIAVVGATAQGVVEVDAHVFLGPPLQVEGVAVGRGGGLQTVVDAVVVAEERTDALHHGALVMGGVPEVKDVVLDTSVSEDLLDMARQILSGKVKVDYDFCKGCGICAKICKFEAIKMEAEK